MMYSHRRRIAGFQFGHWDLVTFQSREIVDPNVEGIKCFRSEVQTSP